MVHPHIPRIFQRIFSIRIIYPAQNHRVVSIVRTHLNRVGRSILQSLSVCCWLGFCSACTYGLLLCMSIVVEYLLSARWWSLCGCV